MGTKVSLRKKAISKGRQSLYLDIYPPITNPTTGEPTRREFLGLYVVEVPKNPMDKEGNKEVLRIAQSIRDRRVQELNKPEIYSEFEKKQLKQRELSQRSFLEYFERLAGKREKSNHDNWSSSFKYLSKFSKGALRFDE
ncbi:MAG: site-specific integrase, partial [Flavobacteriales bacterium]|nr:site-specific integrase [Flavobacteriales bacterium]